MSEETLQGQVQALRVAARETLRAVKMNDLLAKMFVAKNLVAIRTERFNGNELNVRATNYDLTKLDVEHPLFAQRKLNLEVRLEDDNRQVVLSRESLDLATKDMEAIQKDMDNVTSGEYKVSIDELNQLVEDMIRAQALK